MDQQALPQYIADTFPEVDVTTATEGIAAGDAFFMVESTTSTSTSTSNRGASGPSPPS